MRKDITNVVFDFGGVVAPADLSIVINKFKALGLEDIEKYLGISTLALIPMNRAEYENSDKKKSSNNNNGKVMKSLNDAKSKIFKS